MRGLLAASLLLVGCVHHPVQTVAGTPVRHAIAGIQARTATVIREIASSSTNAAASAMALQQDLAATQIAFSQFEARYADSTNRVASLQSKVSTLSASSNFWRGVFFVAAGTLVLCLMLLIIPKIP